MTKVIVHPGMCGFSVTITAEKGERKEIQINLETECEMVNKMLNDIAIIDMMSVFTTFANNPVYQSASRHLKHVACPVPSAILKAIEIAAGLGVPKEVTFTFEQDKKTT